MDNNFFNLLIKEISKTSYEEIDIDAKSIDNSDCTMVYNKILDHIVHNIFFETVENELLLNAFIKLPRLEKIIVVFYIMLDYKASEVAHIANTSIDSVHTQRYKAVIRLRKAISIKK